MNGHVRGVGWLPAGESSLEVAGTDSVPLDKSLLPGKYNEGSRPWLS